MNILEALDQFINVSPPKEIIMSKANLARLTILAVKRQPFLWDARGFTGGMLNIYRGV